MIPQIAITSLQLATRAAAAGGIATALAQWLGLPLPIYAMIAAIIVTDLAPRRTRQLALARIAGTVIGAAIGAGAAPLLGSGVWPVALGILAAMFVAELFGVPEAAKLAGYICAIVMFAHREEPWTYALYRFLETVLGIGVAVAVSLIPKLFAVKDGKGHEPSQ